MVTATVSAAQVAAAAERLWQAQLTTTPCEPVRDLVPDLSTAYAVQRRVVEQRLAAGSGVVGRKIGLTSAAVQAQLRVDSPDVGVLLDDMELPSGRPARLTRMLQPRVEAEIAFVLGSDLGPEPTPDQVRAATAYVVVALEICDSRIAGWDITLIDTVSDNASCGAFVLGAQRHALGDIDLRTVAMTMACDGTVVSTGVGADCLGDPVAAVAWLARTAAEQGDPLRAGEVVLSGALGPMVAVRPGQHYKADVSRLGSVEITFEGAA